jgi:hypothetical protein
MAVRGMVLDPFWTLSSVGSGSIARACRYRLVRKSLQDFAVFRGEPKQLLESRVGNWRVSQKFALKCLAPQVGLEPTTLRLTAGTFLELRD